ncbi:MAG TPA: glycosyltransferase [Usitatibacter sp.]|nr:glycosyltransferase [Usitatibacter sp.]
MTPAEHPDVDRRDANLTRRLEEAERQLATQKALVAERDAHIAALRSSWSWRVTAPLRAAVDAAKKVTSAARTARALAYQLGGYRQLFRAVADVSRREGFGGVWLRSKLAVRDAREDAGADPWGDATGTDLKFRPVISVLMPVYNTPEDMLDAAIWSVRRQTYSDWELIAVDDASPSAKVRSVMQFHAGQDSRVKIRFRAENGNISAALNTALELAKGDFMAVLDHDDVLDPKALYGIARTINEHPDVDYVYTDEDKVSADGSIFYGPFYKPDWSPEYLHSLMYTCHLGAYRMSIVRKIGGYRTDFDGAQDFDFTLRFLLHTDRVKHVPRVLYHWRVWEASTAHSPDAKPYAELRARKALEESLSAAGENFTIGPGPRAGHHEVRFLPRGEPLVSIVIPTANGKIEIDGRIEWHADAVIASIMEKSTYGNFEVVLIHNGDLREEQLEMLRANSKVRLMHYQSAKFSLAQKINQGCYAAKGEYLVIMNDDIRVISPDWLERMLGMAQRKGVGAVGPKLLFPDGRIQHAGVVILGGCPGHAYYEWPGDAEGYGLGAMVNRNYLAVTGACLMTPKKLFEEVGGFALKFPLNYNDVDFCLKLHERGYRSVYMPGVSLYHFEGVSKEGGRNVGRGELEDFLAEWSGKIRHDPYYNKNLSQHAPYQF